MALVMFNAATIVGSLFYLYFIISGSGAFNGVVKIATLKNCVDAGAKKGALNLSTALCCLELFAWTLALILGIHNGLKVKQVYGKHTPIFAAETEVAAIERKEDDRV